MKLLFILIGFVVKNDEIDSLNIRSTNNLAQIAGTDEDHQCLWQRGLLPQDMVEIPPEHAPSNISNFLILNFQSVESNFLFDSGKYYGDGSGGLHSQHQTLRRCGLAIVRLAQDGNSVAYAIQSNLPGPVQTVPRSEIYATILLLTHAQRNTELEYYTDHKNLMNNYNQGLEYCKSLMNYDLYLRIFQLKDNKRITLHIKWLPAHTDTKDRPIPDGITAKDIFGNKQADIQAVAAANKAELPVEVTAPIIYNIQLVQRIQRRLADIIMSLPKRSKHHNEPIRAINRNPPIESLFATSEHIPTYNATNTRIHCTRCRSHVSISCPKEVRQWLEKPCRAIGTDREQPVPINYDNMKIGHQTIDMSHKVFTYKGLIYCRKCGGHAGKNHIIHKLAHPCKPGETLEQQRWGKQVVDKIQAGQLPYGVKQWPCFEK